MQIVRSPICQRKASVALRLYSTALPPFSPFFFFFFVQHVLIHPCVPSVCALHCTLIFATRGEIIIITG